MSTIDWHTGMIVTGGRIPDPESAPIRYFVAGGVHTDTTFSEVVAGTEERYGPYDTYEEALKVWRAKTGWQVDICEHRLFIETIAYASDIFA